MAKRQQHHPDFCHHVGRAGGAKRFATEADALSSIHEQEAYQCQHCGDWHVAFPRTEREEPQS
mgnify:CR=1 FL=1